MDNRRRLGIFGGSFDPVHRGHLELAATAQSELHLDKIIFVPARRPPHKKTRELTTAADRLRMLALAIKPCRRFTVSRFEIKRPGTTYTYQTLRYFRRRYPGASLFFIIGSDSLAELGTWKKAAILPKLCTFAVGKRPGAKVAGKLVRKHAAHLLKKPVRSVSSTEIRELVRSRHSLRDLVPPAVARYIARRGLYLR